MGMGWYWLVLVWRDMGMGWYCLVLVWQFGDARAGADVREPC